MFTHREEAMTRSEMTLYVRRCRRGPAHLQAAFRSLQDCLPDSSCSTDSPIVRTTLQTSGFCTVFQVHTAFACRSIHCIDCRHFSVDAYIPRVDTPPCIFTIALGALASDFSTCQLLQVSDQIILFFIKSKI